MRGHNFCRLSFFSGNSAGFRWQALRFRQKPTRFTGDDDREERVRSEDPNRIYLHKSRGQHILTNPRVLDTIVKKADVKPTDTVLEIGPGTGNLTLKLLEAAGKVVAVEIDKRMVEILHNRVSESRLEDKLTVLSGDALKIEFPKFDLCVANIPYGISSPLIAKLLFGDHTFRNATLLLQKEFARRILANPGDSAYNRLAVNVKLVATVEFLMDVSKRDFVPCPKVDSSVVKIQPKSQIPAVDMKEWMGFTRTCFSKKNKTLGAIFKQKKKVLQLLRSQEKNGGLGGAGEGKREVEEFEEDDDDDEEEETGREEEGDGLELGLFKERIMGVLRPGEFENKRPSKLSHDQLLTLLSLFNQAGMRFS